MPEEKRNDSEPVKGWNFRIVPGERTPKSAERFANRDRALANWLLSEWRKKSEAEREDTE